MASPSSEDLKTIHFVSLGCPKNRVDSEVMLGVAAEAGFALTDEAEDAEVIVVNTCGFIGEAKQESIDTIFEMAEMKKVGACKKLVVTGCLSQRYPKELSEQMGEVDHFLGSSDMLKLRNVLDGDAARVLVGNPADWVLKATDPRIITGSAVSAYLKIAEGCNRSCSFCTIPSFRGKQRSRSLDDIVAEARNLVDQGIFEIDLISQDTISWGRDQTKEERRALADMVRAVADVDVVGSVRLFYLYPENIDEALIEVLRDHPKVAKYVDMPLQHAADEMLARMRRGHGKDRQKRVVERLRTAIPDLSFRTAFIVGHPGETEAEFEELVDFVKWAQFEHVGVFKYSDEESSRSAEIEGKVDEKTIAKRHRKLMTTQRAISRKKNKALLGKELDVLVEGVSEEHEFVMKGRHMGQAPDVDGSVFLSGGEAYAGQLRRVRIEQASDYDLVGELLDPDGPPPKARKRTALRIIGAPDAANYR